MDPRDVSNLFAIAVLAGAIVVIVAVLRPSTRRQLSRFAPVVVAVAAVGATAGSLYYSEIADYVPCKLCWYQRIAMYPMALIVPVALWARDRTILRSSVALSAVGLAISAYHIKLQLFPDSAGNSCEITNPCTAKWVEAFGFVTIPQMAGTTFAIILAASIVGLRVRPDDDASSTDDAADADPREPAIAE